MIVCTACTAESEAAAYPEVIEAYKQALLEAAGYPVLEECGDDPQPLD